MREHWLNDTNTFICGWYSDEDSLCDELVAHYEQTPDNDKYEGKFADGLVDKTKKDSHDIRLNPDDQLTQRYFDRILVPALEKYQQKYDRINESAGWAITTNPQLQHYAPGGGYHLWHSERDAWHNSTRWLVYMTYLNTVEEGGGTAFLHQDIEVKAEKGLTLFWPTDWTHTHRGIMAPKEDKWIVTGWYEWTERHLPSQK